MSLSALAFDPQESPHYKVVRFSVPRLFHHRRNYEDPEYVDIFSSKDRRWIDCNVSTGRNIGTFWATISSEDFVFVNGALHLILMCNSLYSFDVKKMFSRTVMLPKGEKSHWDKCIGKSEGRLLVCAYDGFMIYIWMLQNFETGEWVLKHTCPGDTIEKHPAAFIPKPHGYKISLRPLTLHPDVDVLFINIQGKIISFLFSLYYGLLVETL